MKNVTAISQKRQLPRPSEDFISARFTVGRFKVEIHVMLDAPPGFDGQQNIFWTPHAPQQGDLTAADLRHYQKKRNQLFQRWADITGKSAMVVDI